MPRKNAELNVELKTAKTKIVSSTLHGMQRLHQTD